ncbi:hypothetical protein PAXRUDRAFT_513141 [Paxillus rubicundulus Ve08.2h10]|uniref:Unplaced genomic scaffold scaffold_360, whole genome shotgun sequence n=1 Tax=Paxillus rubicundulus Ve08.2h10 TaxID=930991 RepID=A0A0D0E0Q6_9AGAM|nr:hypothetical protein PAXRUDRAFT_513141 [Paxillus rubicundulus Ve08.2h10]
MFGNMSEKLYVVIFGLWLSTRMRLSTHQRRLVWSLRLRMSLCTTLHYITNVVLFDGI